jgi:hypothetical protein
MVKNVLEIVKAYVLKQTVNIIIMTLTISFIMLLFFNKWEEVIFVLVLKV